MSLLALTGCNVSSVTHGPDSYARSAGSWATAQAFHPGLERPFRRGWAAIDGAALAIRDERGHTELVQRQRGEVVPPT